MSEGDVSLIRDEDLLRRMWQQTEDFSRKKEIRAHMYRLREERLRNLYSPEPTREGKGSEFTAAQDHVKSFADQSFQSMKSKEVRDAGSPPKEFTYRGQDLKALSNAGWNVEQENKTTDDGHTHVKSIHANIEGKYDVDGGRGQFAAVDHHKEAVTEYHDDNSSLKRNETSSNTAAREQVVRQTDDGTKISSTTSSSTSSSKFQQMSSTRHESVPYVTNDDYDLRSYDTNRNDNMSSLTRKQITKTNDYEQNLKSNEQFRRNDYEQTVRRSDYETGELVSRKVDYPDDNTRVIVETRCLPDGTRVTSTKKEFRAPVQSTRSEQSYQTSENKSYSTQQRSNIKDSSSKVMRHVIDNRENSSTDIVDSQRNVDDYDFKMQTHDYTTKDSDEFSDVKHYETKTNKKNINHTKIDDDYSNVQRVTKINKTIVDNSENDNDFSNTQRYHTTTNKRIVDNSKIDKDYSRVQYHENKVNQQVEDSKTDVHKRSHYTTSDDREILTNRDDNANKQPKNYEDVPQTTRTEPRSTQPRDSLPRDTQPRYSEPKDTYPKDTQPRSTDDRIHKITTDRKIDEIIEKKTNTEQYQTTYQTDFTQKKISNDWSPTHTAWASSLRADTPTTARPSTRASSPGSRTFRSSTSSLRSSVSPDKTHRKPSSRGGSPSKGDRSSPTRTTSDRQSSTYSTHSATETKSHKYSTSDDNRPSSGRSPTRPAYSPERKPLDRQRTSASPDKRPQNLHFRSSASPDRKPTQKSPIKDYSKTRSPTRPLERHGSPSISRESPERKQNHPTSSVSGYPTSPSRPSVSPERTPAGQHPKDSSVRSSPSPDRQPGYQKPELISHRPRTTSPAQSHHSDNRGSTPKTDSVSPERKPGYMRPTVSSQPSDHVKSASVPFDRSSPSPTRRSQNHTITTSKIRDDHYKFIDEETKMYSPTGKTTTDFIKRTPTHPEYPTSRDKSPSPSRKSLNKGNVDGNKIPRRKSPSPKQNVTITEKHDQLSYTTVKSVDVTDNVTHIHYTPKDQVSSSDKTTTPRESSSSKFGTYDKNKPYTEETEVTTTKDTKDTIKYDSLTRREKPLKKSAEQPAPPTKKGPRDSVSPVKSPTKETKYRHTTNFISTEKTTEEFNKKTTNEHSRKLVTPSSSPTRTPKKPTETEPSTGQSSPTTSVSGFVYYSSPRTETTIVTDLDDQEHIEHMETHAIDETTTTYKRPESLDVNRSSPSKIPCRSPSPEKPSPLTQNSLPRKSSLKKPTTGLTQASPVEKPPSSFRVSPTEEPKEFPDHKVVKKDNPEQPETKAPIKVRPPLERRETYEDRCRKILGMTEDTETVTKQTSFLKESETNLSSASISPCRSPVPKVSQFEYPTTTKVSDTKVDVTDFITREKENIIKTTTTVRDEQTDKQPKPLRDASPTKLQDIIAKEKTVMEHDVKADDVTEIDIKKITITKIPSPRQSPDRQPANQDSKKPQKSPERPDQQKPNSPTKPRHNSSPRSSISPKRRPGYEPKSITAPQEPKVKTTGYIETTTTVSHNYDTAEDTEKITVVTEATEIKLSRQSESPTRKTSGTPTPKPSYPSDNSPQRKPEQARKTSPSRPVYLESTTSMVAEYGSTEDIQKNVLETTRTKHTASTPSKSPTRKPPSDVSLSRPGHFGKSPVRKPSDLDTNQEKKPADKKESPSKQPDYMKSTTSVKSKHDITTEDHLETDTKTYSRRSESPSGKTSKDGTSKPYHPTNASPDRKRFHDHSPTSPESELDHKNPKDSTPGKQAKMPGYMRTTEAVSSKFGLTTTENVEDISVAETTEHRHPSVSPIHETSKTEGHTATSRHFDTEKSLHCKPSVEITPHYMTPISSHHHVLETDTGIKDEYEISTSTIEHSSPLRSHSPTNQAQIGKIPHYMTSIAPHRHTHETIVTDEKHETSTHDSITHEPNMGNIPHYMTPTSAHLHKHDIVTAQHEFEICTSSIIEKKQPSEQSPDRKSTREELPRTSPERKLDDKYPKDSFPIRQTPTNKTPSYMKTTESVASKYESTSENIKQNVTSTVIEHHHPTGPSDSSSTRKALKHTSEQPRTKSPSKSSLDSSIKKQKLVHHGDEHPQDSSPTRPSSSTNKKPGYMRPTASVTSKHEVSTIEDVDIIERYSSPRSSLSPSRTQLGFKEPEELKHSRASSPNKKTIKVSESNTDFLISEREQEILDRVQKSLRKLSPERKEKSPSRERSPSKTTTSLQDIDIKTVTSKDDKTEEFTKTSVTKQNITTSSKPTDGNPKGQKAPSKPTSRNVSPTKKSSSTVSPAKFDRNSEAPTKTRSISPKKPVSSTERPQSPHVPRASNIKPKEQIPSHLTRKPTPATLNITKTEKTVTDLKKSIGSIKHNSFTKMTTSKTTSKSSEPRAPTPKDVRESGIPKKETDIKVTRTVSDITIKSKRPSPTSPQRMNSKPEIQVSDMSTSKTPSKIQKSSLREPQTKFTSKPKSATTLNTPGDEDDIIIDVQQSKSSRENSPDRICPTPVNFTDDVSTPRYPDEVKEPDDEFRRHTYHTIHETESIVDDIVEICEDDELFVRKSDIDHLTKEDESLLSVTDKVTRFTKGIDTTKPKDTTSLFKDTEKKVHSDFVEQNLKSDECLLSVSEKVNKFAKGPKDIKEKSPARKVVDEYDRNTTYTDDYTKLSVHDKAHLFVETAENVKVAKIKSAPQKVERPDLTNVDEALKSDDCLLSVSDKVHKFVKTAEQFLSESHDVEEKEKKIKEQHEIIMKQIIDNDVDNTYDIENTDINYQKVPDHCDDIPSFARETTSSHGKVREQSTPSLKPTERAPTVKITTLRSSEAVKKAKALFENIATTTQKTKETIPSKTTTKLTDIGVIKKSPKTDSTVVLHQSVEERYPNTAEMEREVDSPHHSTDRAHGVQRQPLHPHHDDKPRASPTQLTVQVHEGRKSKSPMRQTVETTTTTKTVVTRFPVTQRAESPKHRPEVDKTTDKIPGYLRPTKTSHIKEETNIVEETEVSSRRGSGKFGVELRRTSVERSTASSERRRSVEHPCIEDIFDLDLLEQMLEKVVGYEQRRRIRAQIRIARKKSETNHLDSTTRTRTTKQTVTTTPKIRSPERHYTKSPDRTPKSTPHQSASPERHSKTPQKTITERSYPKEHVQPVLNGHAKEPAKLSNDHRQRPQSPEKLVPKSVLKTKTPIRQSSPDKKTRPHSPTKTATPKPKANRFNEYASAYMKKVGLSEADKLKFAQTKKKSTLENQKTVQHVKEHRIEEEYSTTEHFTERTTSKDLIEVLQVNGCKRSPSPEKRQSPIRKTQSPERIYDRSPSPVRKQVLHHTKSEPTKKETIIKTVYDIEKKIPQKPVQEDKPSWVTNRNLKKITSETRTYSSKKIEEKPKYRAASPSKVITKPIDVITSSYGPGPLDADGKPLFGIRALRNGASNYQVKGTVIRQEYHSRNGGEPEGTVSVTAYSSEPEELERLLQSQGEQPSKIHGLAAITTTKKFGGDTGTTLKEIHGREERAAIDQFTHSDRRVSDTRIEDISESFDRHEVSEDTRRIDSRTEEIVEDKTKRMQKREQVEKKKDKVEKRDRPDDKKTVRQSSVKSLTEKYIKSANENSKPERTAYPKAGLILRTANMKDSVSSDSSAHAGLNRTDSEHSLTSVEDTVVTTERCEGGMRTVSTTRTHGHVIHGYKTEREQKEERSFLDSNTKVTGVQDILTRMRNADIVIQEGDTTEDTEARALLNKFLGATVLMAGMQSYVTEKPTGKVVVKQETVRTSSSGSGKVTSSQTRNVQEFDVDQCWDERLLKKLLDECNDYEQRRRLRARIRTLMAEQEACASAVTEALAAAGEAPEESTEAREEEEVTVTSSVRRNSSEKTVSSSTTTTKTSKVIESMTRPAPKPVSPFAKFRQLEKQNSTNSPNSASPKSPGSPAPYFKFTDPALQASAVTIKERLLHWCRDKTRDYENVKLENFSTSWADGLAFCALLHHFLPDTFDYSKLKPETRRHNFTLAFKLADEKAGIYPLLDVDDMVAMRKPDWKCVFTYVQSIYRRFKDHD